MSSNKREADSAEGMNEKKLEFQFLMTGKIFRSCSS